MTFKSSDLFTSASDAGRSAHGSRVPSRLQVYLRGSMAAVCALTIAGSSFTAKAASRSVAAAESCAATDIVGKVGSTGRPRNLARASGELFDCLAEHIEARRDAAVLALLTEVIEVAPEWGEAYEQRYLHRAAVARDLLTAAKGSGEARSCLTPGDHAKVVEGIDGALSDLSKYQNLAGSLADSGMLASERKQLESDKAGLGDAKCQCAGRDAALPACAESEEVKAAAAKAKADADEAERKAAEDEKRRADEAAAAAAAKPKKENPFKRLDRRLAERDGKLRALHYAGAGSAFVGVVLGVVSLPFIASGSRLGKQQAANSSLDPALESEGRRADTLAKVFGISGAALVVAGAAMIATPILLRKRKKGGRQAADPKRAEIVAYPMMMDRGRAAIGLAGRF